MNYRLIGLKARIGVVSLSNLSVTALVKAVEAELHCSAAWYTPGNLASRQWMASVKETISLLTKIRRMIAKKAWDPSFSTRAFAVFDLIVCRCLPKPTAWNHNQDPVLTSWDLGGVELRDCGSGSMYPSDEEVGTQYYDSAARDYKWCRVRFGTWWIAGPTEYPAPEVVAAEQEKEKAFGLLASAYRRRVVESLRLGRPLHYVPGQMGGVFLINSWSESSQEELNMRVPAAGAMKEAFGLIDRTEAFEYLPGEYEAVFVALDRERFHEQVAFALKRRIAEGLSPSMQEARKSLSTQVLKMVLIRRGLYQAAGQ